MPSKSKAQHNLMEAVAHSKKFAKKVGIPQSVGKDFAEADKGRKFGLGGNVNITRGGHGMINKQETRRGSTLGYQKSAPNTNLNKFVGKKEGGIMKYDKTPKAGSMSKEVEAGSNKLLKFGESAVQKRGHTKGKNLGDTGPIKGIMSGAKKMAKGGTASARADGCAMRGKTRGTSVMMKKGGKC
jgi:hypothetical protein